MRIQTLLSRSGFFLAFLATIIWSGNFVVARGLNTTYSPITIAFFRWGIASLVIIPLAYNNIKRDLPKLKQQWPFVSFMALIITALFTTFIYQAAHSTPALNLSLIAITAPLYVVLLNRFINKESLHKRQILGLVILFVGLLLLISKGNLQLFLTLEFNTGDLWMAAAACLFGLYTVLLPRNKSGNFTFVAVTIVLGELMLLPFFIRERLLTDSTLLFTSNTILQLLYIGIGPSIISFYLWNKSITVIGSTKAATIYNTIPIYSAFFAFLFLNEPVLPIQIISSIGIIAGVLLVIWNKR